MTEFPAWLLQVIQMAGGAAVAYAGIRADLARLHERINHVAEDTERAHRRIDRMMGDRYARSGQSIDHCRPGARNSDSLEACQ